MKKVKVMMTAIALFAVIGGALAFKARTFSMEFCTRRFADGPGFCQAGYMGKIATNAVGSLYYTRTTDNAGLCAGVTNCNISTRLSNIEP